MLIRIFQIALFAAASFTCGVQQATAQSELQQQAEAALVAGQSEQAAAFARDILDSNPNDFIGLYLLGLAQTDLGDHATAASTARRAYKIAQTEEERFQAAQLVASARFRAKNYIAAEFWLRRAVNHAQTDEDIRAVAIAYASTIQANPLSVQFTAFVAPSDNVNNGSEDGILQFESIGLTFELPEDRRSLSGLIFSAGANLSYRLSQSDKQLTALTAALSGETYVLSNESKDLLASSPLPEVRDVDGSDFATLLLEVGLRRVQNDLSPFGQIGGRLNFGTFWDGGQRVVNYRDVIIDQRFPVNAQSAFNLQIARRDQTALTQFLLDSITYDVGLDYNQILTNRSQLRLSVDARKREAGTETSFDEYRAGIGYAFAQPIWGTRLSTAFEVGYREFDEFTTTLDGRRDRFFTAQVNATFEEITYFGFSPSVSFSTTRTVSSAEENTSSAVELLIGIESNF